MKVIVAHPDRQHSFFLATALKKKGILDAYITTIYDKETSITARVKKILKGNIKKKAASRKCEFLDDKDVIQYNELFNLCIVFLSKFPKLLNLCRLLRMRLADSFGIKVAKKAIADSCDIVIMYDGTALSCFRYLEKHAPEIVRVLDTSIVSHSFMKDVFEKECSVTKDDVLKQEYAYLWKPRLLKRYDDEIELAQYFLVPSRVVAESLKINNGVKEYQLLKVPYGVNIDNFKVKIRNEVNKRLKLVFVGQVTCRKGIHHILNAINQFDSDQIEIAIAGAYDQNEIWYKENCRKENVKFLGFVTRDKIVELYNSADVFVLPSLAEGMALVGLEALACGLPVVCSKYAGIDDIIEEKKNGFICDVFEENSLIDIFNWCIKNKSKLLEMKEACRSTAEKYSWDIYYENVAAAVMGLLRG